MNQSLFPVNFENIDADAVKIIRRLHRYGFEAYLVGGCVRDLLLNLQPKDFDVATSATPPEIKQLFRNCRIIGRRFRLAHIFFGKKIIETSTFRAQPPAELDATGQTEIIRRDNIFGTAKEDALRRDFTINGLFHDLQQNRIIDYVGGLEDLRARKMRTIGDPRIRIQEDPVRILRAIKFAARLNFSFDPATEAAMVEFRGRIADCSLARVLEEIYRLLSSGKASPAVHLMHQTGVLSVLLPEVQAVLSPPNNPLARTHVRPITPLSSAALPKPSLPPADEAEPTQEELLPPPACAGDDQQDEDELSEVQLSLQHLIDELIGEASQHRERAEQWLWRHLEALDQSALNWSEPPSHAYLLASALIGIASRQLTAVQEFGKSIANLEYLVKYVASRLRISRRDRELLKQILIAQRRLVTRGKRVRPAALLRRDYFPEAWQFFEMSCQATGYNREALGYWQQLMSTKTRRRKRKSRPRRRPSTPKI